MLEKKQPYSGDEWCSGPESEDDDKSLGSSHSECHRLRHDTPPLWSSHLSAAQGGSSPTSGSPSQGETAMPWQSVAPGSASSSFSLPLQVLACQLVLSKETSRTRKYPSLLGGGTGDGLSGLSGGGGKTWEGRGSALPSWRGGLLGACVFVGD